MNRIFTLLFLLIVIFNCTAETPGDKSNPILERSMFKQAEKYFVKKDYQHATPLYAQLVSTHPDNYKLNYCYGICLLITDKDKSGAVKYLEDASKSILVWDDVWYYLGRAYQLNGEFAKSLSAYDQFLKMVSIKQVLRWDAIHQMEMCKNAEVLVKDPDSINILEIKTVNRARFNDVCNFKNDERKFLVIPGEFASSKDKKNVNCGQTFLSADGKKMVFASYGREGAENTDIFIAEKNDNGTWQKPQNISQNVNTKYDEVFPTLSLSGNILYFSSRGHNSMGGFDIFKSEYYSQTRQWSKPQNMGVPVNSPDDDFYYLSSEAENIAYFSSKRGCNAEDINVYKIVLNDEPDAVLVINGEVNNAYAVPYRQAIVMVTGQHDGEIVASFTSDAINGKYRFTLPGGGDYRISVKIEGFGPMAQAVSFSPKAHGRIKQTINVSKDTAGYDKLSIINIFETNVKNEVIASTENAGVYKPAPGEMDLAVAKVNHSVSTGFEPVTVYAADGLPTVSAPLKEKLSNYFNQNGIQETVYSNDLINQRKVNEKGSVYKVQIGTFMHQTIPQIYEKLKELGFSEISYYTNKKGWIIFYSGHSDNISSALKLKDIVINYGFSDAFITVFEDGKPSRVKNKNKNN